MSNLPKNEGFVVMINAKNSYEQQVLFGESDSGKQESDDSDSPQKQAWAHIQRHQEGLRMGSDSNFTAVV